MSRVIELFGADTTSSPGASPIDWRALVNGQPCPFLKRQCIKVRKSQPSIAIGTCTVANGKGRTPIIICPHRLLERRQIFTDCLSLLTAHEPGNELHAVAEVTIPGGSVDYFPVSVAPRTRKVRDFVGIELQTMDTTGTVWPERHLEVKGQDDDEQRTKRQFLDEWVRAVNSHGGFGEWSWAVSRQPLEVLDILEQQVGKGAVAEAGGWREAREVTP